MNFLYYKIVFTLYFNNLHFNWLKSLQLTLKPNKKMNTEFITIIILLAYIGFLHFQLYTKNSFIESLVKKQLNIESALSREGLEDIIKQLKGLSNGTQVKHSKLFDKEIQDFFLKVSDKNVVFIRITKEGFLFADSFYKTAEAVTNDKLDLVYKHNLRKNFGKFVVVIGIDKNVYNHYLTEIANSNKVLSVEQIISKKHPQLNENLDEVYLLPNKYIKGFVNIETGEIHVNKDFNPKFDSPELETNLNSAI